LLRHCLRYKPLMYLLGIPKLNIHSHHSGTIRPYQIPITIWYFNSTGYVGIDGHIPVSSDPEWVNFFSISPMCRYAEDLPLYMRAISDPDKRANLKLEEPVSNSSFQCNHRPMFISCVISTNHNTKR
jgi:hypothetical protein